LRTGLEDTENVCNSATKYHICMLILRRCQVEKFDSNCEETKQMTVTYDRQLTVRLDS